MLPEQPAEIARENLVAEPIQQPHASSRHRINETRSPDELTKSRPQRFVNGYYIIRRRSHVCFEQDDEFAAGPAEAFPNGVALAAPRLGNQANVLVRTGRHHALDLCSGSVVRMALDDENLLAF